MASPVQRTDLQEAIPAQKGGRSGDLTDASPVSDTLSILRVAADLYPAVTGGFPIHAHSMSKRQAEQGHDVTVLTSDHGDADANVEVETPYSVVRHRQLVSPFGNSITPGIAASIRKRLSEADVIHAHSHLYFATNVAATIARFSEVPLVVTNHGLMSQTAPVWIQQLFIPTVGQFTFNAAERVLCYTDTDRRRLERRGVNPPVTVVKNGVNCEQFSPASVTERRQILYVGRLTDGKGVPTLLDAFERLARRHPELELLLVGDGPGRERYEKRCERAGVADRVSFVGSVPYSEMPRYYRRSMVSVLPSHNEGLPRTVLEAMACATPVVTSDLSQLEPLVANAGYTVEQGSVDGFADAINRLIEDEDRRRQFGEAGRRMVRTEHAWDRTVERTTNVLRAVAEDSA